MEIYLEIFPTMPLLNKHKNQCELWFNKFLLRFLGCRNYSKFKESASDNRCCIFLFSNSVVTLQHCEILLSRRNESHNLEWDSSLVALEFSSQQGWFFSYVLHLQQGWTLALGKWHSSIPFSNVTSSNRLVSYVTSLSHHHLCYSILILLNLCTQEMKYT